MCIDEEQSSDCHLWIWNGNNVVGVDLRVSLSHVCETRSLLSCLVCVPLAYTNLQPSLRQQKGANGVSSPSEEQQPKLCNYDSLTGKTEEAARDPMRPWSWFCFSCVNVSDALSLGQAVGRTECEWQMSNTGLIPGPVLRRVYVVEDSTTLPAAGAEV